mgnify:CR=1 FL=1
MSALINFTGKSSKTGETFRAIADLNDNAPYDVRYFVEELDLIEDGELVFDEGENADNLDYESVADFVEYNPQWFTFRDEEGKIVDASEKWGYFGILSF